MGSYILMTRFNLVSQCFAFCLLSLCFSQNSNADDIQDANKLFKQGQHTQALSKIDAILSSKPKDSQARFMKALILAEQGQTEESIHMYNSLIQDFPDLPEPYNNLAVLYAGQGQFEKAKIALEKALRTHASYSTAHENLGDIYAKMASQAYDKALQLDRSKSSPVTKLVSINELVIPAAPIMPTKTLIATATPVAIVPFSAPTTAVIVNKPVSNKPASAPDVASAVETKQTKTDSMEAASNDAEILKAINEWIKAWTSKNANKYLAMYAKNFKTPGNENRSAWEQQRRERIDKPQPIIITISNFKVRFQDENHAIANFIQSYRSGALKSNTYKTMEMTNEEGKWLIDAEWSGRKK